MKTLSLLMLAGALAPAVLSAQSPPPPASVPAASSTSNPPLEALRREKVELLHRQATSARRLAGLELEEKIAETEKQLSLLRDPKEDRKAGAVRMRLDRLRADRQSLQEVFQLEEQLETARGAADKRAFQDLEERLAKAREIREFTTTQMDLDEARARVRELEERLAQLSARRGK
ncbi:MAG: hypothetical protein HY303_03440 [Candidatus Wallbacteria bacterium]|nr:hypothetical protein [Candidatus Wallbacteria bacterium]